MDETYKQDGQYKKDINRSLVQLAQILRAIGVEELTIENDFQYHLVNSERKIDPQFITSFCGHVSEMYDRMVIAN